MERLIEDIITAPSLHWEVVLARLTGAVVFCGIIGFERETRDRPAGLRTHMLVGLAAALYCILMLELLAESGRYTDRVAMDPLRLLSSVTSGVAFLAAGMIVFAQGKVRGLTTGASLWLTAAIGLSCGLGQWLIAFMTTVLALLIIRLIKVAEDQARRIWGAEAVEEDE